MAQTTDTKGHNISGDDDEEGSLYWYCLNDGCTIEWYEDGKGMPEMEPCTGKSWRTA